MTTQRQDVEKVNVPLISLCFRNDTDDQFLFHKTASSSRIGCLELKIPNKYSVNSFDFIFYELIYLKKCI